MSDTVKTGANVEQRTRYIQILCEEFKKNNRIDPSKYTQFQVKRGLRNEDGTGVLAGLTLISNVHGYVISEGEKTAVPGELIYRGINIRDIIAGCQSENRFGFEEVIWLLLFGTLPTKGQLDMLQELIDEARELPANFTEDMIIKAPSNNIMNKLARSVLALYSYDDDAECNELENEIKQSLQLIARLPRVMVDAYQVKRRVYDGLSMYFHPSVAGLSTAQNILRTMRIDQEYTDEEAKLLDLCLILHAEHGGGNNSTFTTRVLTSSGTDIYSAISAAIGSLKGPRHGGANIKVMEMFEHIKRDVKNWQSEEEVAEYLRRIMRKEVGDRSGLIYGIGHPVYTVSDPRAIILKENARSLSVKTGLDDEFALFEMVERLSPVIYGELKGDVKMVCTNVDFYSGLVYKMLKIPPELFTPLFAVSRIPGWCAHRIEEITTSTRVVRPAYKSLSKDAQFIPLNER